MKKQFSRFIVIGLISTLVNYLIFFGALHYLSLQYLVASAIGFIGGVIVGFFCNKSWTFESRDTKSRDIVVKYSAVYLASLVIGMICLKIMVDFLYFSPELANFLVIGVTTCTNFVGVKTFVFKK